MKIVLLSALVLGLASTAAMAATGPEGYVTGQLGYSNSKPKGDADGAPTIKGATGVVTAGVRAPATPNVYVGAEANYQFNDASEKQYGIDYKNKGGFGVAAVAGTKVTNEIEAYGKIGYQRTKVEASALGVTESENMNGVRFGVGTNYYLDPQVSLNAEYDFTRYKKDDVKLNENLFLVGASYHF